MIASSRAMDVSLLQADVRRLSKRTSFVRQGTLESGSELDAEQH